ncbi:MAG: acetylglutamate kinase [Clostridia bacterium]|nr:acetylglutamate kinase [Clostridia bacterium]
MNPYEEKALIISEALPYIQRFSGKTVVVKYGGNAMVNDIMKNAVISDCILLSLVGINTVLVHGGGPEITAMLGKLGKETHFINGLRYTDDETMDIVQMSLAGKVNKDLVTLIARAGGRAVGLCGLDSELICAKKLDDGKNDYGYVGEITSVNTKIIDDNIRAGYIPVIATVAGGDDGHSYNVNADTAAAYIAGALGAEKLILLTDTKGVLSDKDDESTLIPKIATDEIDGYIKQGIIVGGMIPKLRCCETAIRKGVHSAHIIDGRVAHSILIEMFTPGGIGTMIDNTL